MHRHIAQKWVNKLRSGTYKENYRVLRDLDNSYDPIGVLIDLAVEEQVCSWSQLDQGNGLEWGVRSGAGFESSLIPLPVVKWAGLICANPWLKLPTGEEVALTGLYDLKLNFKEIAEILEYNYLHNKEKQNE